LREISSLNIMNNNKAAVLLTLLVLLQAWEGLAGSNRIIGPGSTHFRQNLFPWLVKMQAYRRISHIQMDVKTCGGTLLNPRTVLSAAHCMFWDEQQTQPIHSQMIKLYLGEHNSKKMDIGEKEVGVTRYVLHPEYNKKTYDNDFAIMYMDEVIRESNIIRSACLARPNTIKYVNTPVTIAGWGAIRADGYAVDIARKVDLVTISNRDCGYRFGTITNNMICASGYRKSACGGDSGGPLMVKGRENVVIGVASFAAKDCNMNGNKPTGFARVSTQLRWIKLMAGNICIK